LGEEYRSNLTLKIIWSFKTVYSSPVCLSRADCSAVFLMLTCMYVAFLYCRKCWNLICSHVRTICELYRQKVWHKTSLTC
jgi:hypothetical protein